MKTKFFFAVFSLLLYANNMWGIFNANVNGIRYEFFPKERKAKVIQNEYTGRVTIPSTVVYHDGNYNYITYDVAAIGIKAFRGCKGLTSVTIPNSVTYISNEAFSGCTGLTSITIPNSVKRIESYVFCGCKGLTSATLSDSLESISDGFFDSCESLISVTIPDGVTSIGERAFFRCYGLTSIIIPNSVTYIGKYAFEGVGGLISVELGSSLNTIDMGAFLSCGIKAFKCFSIIPPTVMGEGSYGLPSSTIVYAPMGSLDAYKAHRFWGKFTVIPFNTALEDVFADQTLNELLANPETHVFTLQGVDITAKRNNLPSGVYILRLGNKAEKIAVK